jgi:hypothetical protein
LAHFEIRPRFRTFHRLCSPGVTFIGKVQNWRPIAVHAECIGLPITLQITARVTWSG